MYAMSGKKEEEERRAAKGSLPGEKRG